jgi:hypothetical protein
VQEGGRKGENKKKKKKKRKEQRDRKKNSILRSLNNLEQLSGYSEIVSVRKSFRKNHSASKSVKKVDENELIVFLSLLGFFFFFFFFILRRVQSPYCNVFLCCSCEAFSHAGGNRENSKLLEIFSFFFLFWGLELS